MVQTPHAAGAAVDPAIMAAVADLELVARLTVDGAVSGLHRSPFHGYSAEFSQYRHYRPGDDLKYVDWKLLARTDRIYTRQYRETTNLAAQVTIDASASMAFAGTSRVTKFQYARLLGAALAHLLARQGDAVGLVAYADGLREYVPSRAGQPHLRGLLLRLSRVTPSGTTSTATALRRAIDLLRRRGLLIVASDLYDEGDELDRELRRAVRMGHEVSMFHVLTRDEIEFTFTDELELEDLETGQRAIAGAAEGMGAYRREFTAFLDRWTRRCSVLGLEYMRVTTDLPLDAALRTYLLKRQSTPRR